MAQHNFIVYCVSERPVLLQRLFANIATWAAQPLAVLVITPVKKAGDMSQEERNEWARVMSIGTTLLETQGVFVEYLPCVPEEGIPTRKNRALQWMRVSGDGSGLYDPKYRPYMLSIDDDIVMEPFASMLLYNNLASTMAYVNATGPLLRQPNNTAIKMRVGLDNRLGYVHEGVWYWGDFIQGQFWSPRPIRINVEALICVYMHKFEYGREKFYDTDFQPPNFYMHETDYTAASGPKASKNTNNYVVTSAVAHHWPPETGNMTTNTNFKAEPCTLENIRLYAVKRGLGRVNKIDWSNFREDYWSVFDSYYCP